MSKKKKAIELTERDAELLNVLAKHVIINVENAGKIYQTDRYHEIRLIDLNKAHYIRRKNGYVMLGSKGKEYLKEKGVEINSMPSEKSLIERAKKMSDLYFDFEGSEWRFINSKELKRQYKGMDRGSRFLGMITGRTQYMIYYLDNRYNEKQATLLKKEQSNLYKIGVYRTIVFYEKPKQREIYGVEGLGLKEQLMLPYPYGMELIKRHGEVDLIKYAAENVYKDLKEPEWKEADYTAEGKQIVVLILNDIEKKAKIKNYIEMSKYKYTSRQPVEILCLKGQEEMFREEYPECSIRTIKEEELF